MGEIWDDEDVQPTGGEFVKFPNVGDSVAGTITAIRKQRFEDADGVSYAPQLDLELADGTEVTLTAGQWQLKKLLIEERPSVGDKIKVVHVGKQGRSKLFTLEVKRGTGAAPKREDDKPEPKTIRDGYGARTNAAKKAAATRAAAPAAEPADDDDIPF